MMYDDLHALSGAYAVHALPYAEWVLFEEHLRACERCVAEIRRLRETAARLAESVAEQPPAVLRERLLAEARRRADRPDRVPDDSPTIWRPPETRAPSRPHQDEPPANAPAVRRAPESFASGAMPSDAPTLAFPPAQGQGDAPPPGIAPRPPDAPGFRAGPVPAFPMTREIPLRPEEAGEAPRPEGGGEVVPLRRGRSKVMAGLAAVAAAAAVALGAVAFDARRDLGELAARNAETAAVLAAPDAETLRRPVTSGGTGTIVISRAEGRMVFISSGLAALPDSRTYELWLMSPDGPRPAGLLGPAPGGVTAPILVTPLREDDHVALTVEPAGGSGKPTGKPILLAELPAA
ncbi:anti-sigma factor [Nonomuraea sp. H19]|uniref:anti-sigma factor n=1 Tax=Nonomuraea sp. H19 TaxID=3452206 RepID=UPI003F8CCE94